MSAVPDKKADNPEFVSGMSYALNSLIAKRRSEMSVCVIGNCHRYNVEQILKAANPSLAVSCCAFNDEPGMVKKLLAESDVVFATDFPERDKFGFPENRALILFPRVYFAGFHPDVELMRWEPANASFFSTMQSRIILECFLRGYSESETLAAFNARAYKSLGYLAVMEAEINRLTIIFERHSLDLRQFLPAWLRRGCFMYMPHHPRFFVFIDLVLHMMKSNNIPITYSHNIEDYASDCLWGSPTWPVYPEIAASVAMPEWGSTLFKMKEAVLTLEEFIAMSYATCKASSAPLGRFKRVDF